MPGCDKKKFLNPELCFRLSNKEIMDWTSVISDDWRRLWKFTDI